MGNKVNQKIKPTYAFIDAANIIYGTRDEGWKVDFAKLYKYLKERYKCRKIFYFAGVEENNEKQAKFYKVLQKIGFGLVLRKVKIFKQEDGKQVRKANCDVDLTFYAMKLIEKYQRVLFFSGDGDFDVLLSYYVQQKKEVLVYSNSKRTAREIKTLKGICFNDLKVLKPIIIRYKK